LISAVSITLPLIVSLSMRSLLIVIVPYRSLRTTQI
jgi:hypothetical protein